MCIEDIILTHAHIRGMDQLRRYLPNDFCRETAEAIVEILEGQVCPVALVTTGFYVNGAPETDGPPGAFFLYRALRIIGFVPKVLTDAICLPLFQGWIPPEDLVEVPMKIADEVAFRKEIFATFTPRLLCAVERCGRTREGTYQNMKGEDITRFTAPIDTLFLDPPDGCLTVGIGDGGNEVGMGNLFDAIVRELRVTPSMVSVDRLIVATVSNWGAYGLIQCLELLTGRCCVPVSSEITEWIRECVRRGAVDGISGKRYHRVDGYALKQEREILEALRGCSKGNE